MTESKTKSTELYRSLILKLTTWSLTKIIFTS